MYSKIRNKVVDYYRHLLEKILSKIPVIKTNPDGMTYFSMVLGFIAGLLFSGGIWFWGGLTLLIGGIGDTLDGQMARMAGRATRHGAFLDSSLDRYADFAVFAGFLLFYRQDWLLVFILLGTIGSQMVSYTRARAESLGCKTIVGVMQRPERVLLISTGTIIQALINMGKSQPSDVIIRIILVLLAFLTNATAIRRMVVTISELKKSE